jgi:Protein of unknown function (DUF3800)
VQFCFYCDESYDGNPGRPDTLTISGYFADQTTWEEVEKQWSNVNARYGVSRFHAAPLNHAKGEYLGWSKDKRVQYSAELLRILAAQGTRLVAYNCGMRADVYRRIISEEGQTKLGPPWFACFKSCIAMITSHMETLPLEDSLSVVVERGSGFDQFAVDFFDRLAANPKFIYRHRLNTCTAAKPNQSIGLQVADLMAYEYFRRLHNQRSIMRIPLQRIRESSNYVEGFFGEETLKTLKEGIESAVCGPNELVIIPNL